MKVKKIVDQTTVYCKGGTAWISSEAKTDKGETILLVKRYDKQPERERPSWNNVTPNDNTD